MNAESIIRMNNAGFEILDAIFTGDNHGYCIGINAWQYVTWWFVTHGNHVDFYHGNYHLKDDDSPARSRAKAYADYYNRVANSLEQYSKYGW